jgi:hypothetical protein
MKETRLKRLHKLLRAKRIEFEKNNGRNRSKSWSGKKTIQQDRKSFNNNINKDKNG